MRPLLPLLMLAALVLGLAAWWGRSARVAETAPAPQRSEDAGEVSPSPAADPERVDFGPDRPAPPAPLSKPLIVTRPEDLDPRKRELYLERWRARREQLLAERIAARREVEDRWFDDLGRRVANEFGLAAGTEAQLAAIFREERDRLEEAGREARARTDRKERRRLLDARLREIHAWKTQELERRYGTDLAERILRYVEGEDEREPVDVPPGGGAFKAPDAPPFGDG